MKSYINVLRKYTRYLLRKRGVNAVGYGYKTIGGSQTIVPSIICSVEKKLPKSGLKRFDRIPSKVMGISTDVVEAGVITANEFVDRVRPVPGGASIGHPDITAGTLGGIVKDSEGRRVILSNNHVMAASNAASIGDPIIQPGSFDGGSIENDIIAELSDYVEINFGGSSGGGGGLPDFLRQLLCLLLGLFCDDAPGEDPTDNTVDAAIALPVNDEIVLDEIREIGNIRGLAEATLGMALKKYGRTTEFTQDSVQQIGATVNVNYGSGRQATFVDQIIAGAMSAGGDSGSLVFDSANNAVGLLFAGSDTLTVINPIQHVFEQLNLSL